MEACAGREQDFFHKGTQHDVDGHTGMTLIEAFLKHHMIGRTILMDTLAPGALQAAVDNGKSIKNTIRNQKDRDRRLANKSKQDGDINLVEGRLIRTATWNAQGKLKWEMVKYAAGEVVPKKKTRRSLMSTTEDYEYNLLQKAIVNNLVHNMKT
jgi:hypothetical protein